MKILYLCPLIPDLSGSGGKRAVYNHLMELGRSPDLSLDVIAIDIEGNNETATAILDVFPSKIFQRGLPRFHRGLRGLISAVVQLFISSVPRSVAAVRSKCAVEYVKYLLRRQEHDLIIVDHLNAYALIDEVDIRIPLVYIAHNVETEVLLDRWRHGSFFSFARWFAVLELLKTSRYENRLLKAARNIIAISSGDLQSEVFKKFGEKICCWPELPPLQSQQWQYRKTKKILFVGSARYFPNKEAIEWLVNELMPQVHQLDPNICLEVVGSNQEDVNIKGGSQNVEFFGFVSYDKLLDLHFESDLFISPVILGGGVKIKVLEASALGMPIAVTSESLRGIDYLDGVACMIERNTASAAQTIVQLLSNPDALISMHQAIYTALQQAIRQRNSLESLLKQPVTL